MSKKLKDPLDHLARGNAETAAPAPVALGVPCPSCGQTMTRAYSSGKRIVFCEKDGVALAEDHFDVKQTETRTEM